MPQPNTAAAAQHSHVEPSGTRMTALLFCDWANRTDDGKYNLVGVFSRIALPDEPTEKLSFYAYVQLLLSDPGPLEIISYDPDGSVGLRLKGPIERRETGGAEPGVLELVIPFGIAPGEFGVHWWEARFEGTMLGRVPLFVERLEADGDSGGPQE